MAIGALNKERLLSARLQKKFNLSIYSDLINSNHHIIVIPNVATSVQSPTSDSCLMQSSQIQKSYQIMILLLLFIS